MNPLAAPAPSPLDLKWRLFGIHFRVHPSFWLVNLLFGYLYIQAIALTNRQLFTYLGIWVVCAFVSILVHELGHVIAGRLFGERGDILLHSMGGLAIGQYQRLARWQRILLTFAGPAAGLLLWAFVRYAVPPLDAEVGLSRVNPWYFEVTCDFLLLQNLFWSLFNLIPIIPLDGGMIMMEVVSGIMPGNGLRLAYGISFLIAGAAAVYSGLKMYNRQLPYPPLDPLFNIIIFGMFAYQSFMGMQALAAQERRLRYEEREW